MLPVSLDDNAVYEVLRDYRQGYRLLLVRKEQLEENAVLEPLWVFPCGDQRSLSAATRWFAVRRGLWQAWGKMAEESGSAALYDGGGTHR
jgi:hypothetical protein